MQSRPPDADLTDHFDGKRFFNPGLPVRPIRIASAVLRRQIRRGRIAWERPPPDPAFPPFPGRIDHGTVAVGFVGHSTFLLRLPGGTVLTDPIFSRRCSPVSWAGPRRARPPGIAFDDLPRIDVVVISHSHYDHMDLPTLRRLRARDDPTFVTTRGNERTLRGAAIEAHALDWWEETRAAAPFRIVATPARHFAARTPWDMNRSLWGGFLIEDRSGDDGPGGTVLFGGDSGAGPHWAAIRERLGPPAVALLPIGAYLPRAVMRRVHMDPLDAVDAHLALGAGRSIGMHFGTFQLTGEAIDAPPRALATARRTRGVPDADFVTQGFGETRIHSVAPLHR